MLASRRGFEETRVLDLYAGSGALGFEALSRGARFALFVERDAVARDCIAANADNLGVANDVRISADEVVSYLRCRPALWHRRGGAARPRGPGPERGRIPRG
jgi:16S rRNA G966 N2-methylase RsmD